MYNNNKIILLVIASFLNTGIDNVDPMTIFNHEYELSFVPVEDERRRFAWIPSSKTKTLLEKVSQMNHTLPRDMLTMPGVENVNFVRSCIFKIIYNICTCMCIILNFH